MRGGSWMVFGLLVASESAESSSGNSEIEPPQAATRPPASSIEAFLQPVRRIELPDPLPAIATSFPSPALEVERGRCSLTLKRLAPSALDGVRSEFESRNPGAKVIEINPFTGRLERVRYFRDEAGSRIELSDEALQSRRLAPLRRNADLFGLTAADLDSLEWDTARRGEPVIHLMTTRGKVGCRDEAGRLGAGQNPCWKVAVDLLQDGVVSSVQVNRFGPPVPMGTTPAISEATLVATGGLVDATARRRWGRTPRKAVGKPALSTQLSFDETWLNAPSVTWRLVWEAKFSTGLETRTLVLDAANGKLLEVKYGRDGGFVGDF